MKYKQEAFSELNKNLEEIMKISVDHCKNEKTMTNQDAYHINTLAHKCKVIINKLESDSKK